MYRLRYCIPDIGQPTYLACEVATFLYVQNTKFGANIYCSFCLESTPRRTVLDGASSFAEIRSPKHSL